MSDKIIMEEHILTYKKDIDTMLIINSQLILCQAKLNGSDGMSHELLPQSVKMADSNTCREQCIQNSILL